MRKYVIEHPPCQEGREDMMEKYNVMKPLGGKTLTGNQRMALC